MSCWQNESKHYVVIVKLVKLLSIRRLVLLWSSKHVFADVVERIAMKFGGLNQYHAPTLGGTREQDATENSNRRPTAALPRSD